MINSFLPLPLGLRAPSRKFDGTDQLLLLLEALLAHPQNAELVLEDDAGTRAAVGLLLELATMAHTAPAPDTPLLREARAAADLQQLRRDAELEAAKRAQPRRSG